MVTFLPGYRGSHKRVPDVRNHGILMTMEFFFLKWAGDVKRRVEKVRKRVGVVKIGWDKRKSGGRSYKAVKNASSRHSMRITSRDVKYNTTGRCYF